MVLVRISSLFFEPNTNDSLGWGVPFVWAGIWAAISVPWIRRSMHNERISWEEDTGCKI